MCSRFTPLPAVLLALLGACATESDTFKESMWQGKHYYDHGRFAESADHYIKALQEKRDYYPALLGLACASAEYSHVLYEEADQAFKQQKRDLGVRLENDADTFAKRAGASFQRCFQIRADDPATYYNYGLFMYKRASTLSDLPYPAAPEPLPQMIQSMTQERKDKWKKGYEQRRQDLQTAIDQFGLVLKGDAGQLGTVAHVRVCKSSHAHRYLGLALFLRSDWSKRDADAARDHLLGFLAYVQDAREGIIKRRQAKTDDEKAAKERDMRRLEGELTDVKILIRDRLTFLKQYEAQLKKATSEELKAMQLTTEQCDQRIAAVTVEIAAVTELVRQFDRAGEEQSSPAPKEQGKP